jgi:7-keto-8-aminopelargonate synthetase-like enzyme
VRLLGNTAISLALERSIAETLHVPHALLFPTGWAAGYGAVVALVRPDDHIVMDELAHACLQSGAKASTRNVVRVRHLDTEAFRAAIQMNSRGRCKKRHSGHHGRCLFDGRRQPGHPQLAGDLPGIRCHPAG